MTSTLSLIARLIPAAILGAALGIGGGWIVVQIGRALAGMP
jgi:hypothetical protein